MARQWRTMFSCDTTNCFSGVLDPVEIDVGNEMVNASINAGRLLSMNVDDRLPPGQTFFRHKHAAGLFLPMWEIPPVIYFGHSRRYVVPRPAKVLPLQK